MSHYWGLRCQKCGDECGSVNRGDTVWPEVIKLWPAIRSIAESVRNTEWPWFVEMSIRVIGNDPCGDDEDLWQFLLEHEDHGILMVSEYEESRYPPVVLIGAK